MAQVNSLARSDIVAAGRWDAEYFRPAFLAQSAAIGRLHTVPLSDVAEVRDGNHLSIAEEFDDAGVRYLRGKDLADFFISDADPVYIPHRVYRALSRSHMVPGDVLVGIVGTIGSVGLVTDRHGPLTGNCKLAIVRTKERLPPEYIAAFLASKLGQNEIQRRIRGSVQMGLILPDLKSLPVIVPGDAVVETVVRSIELARAARTSAAQALSRAEQLIGNVLGLQRLSLNADLTYTRSFSDLRHGGRLGAEYYMPCKARALAALGSLPNRSLSDHYREIRELYDPNEASRSSLVRNYDVTAAIEPVLDNTAPLVDGRSLGSTKKCFRAGDIVVSRLRWYLREIAVVRTDGHAVGSTEFVVLRPQRDELPPEVLLAYIRSPIIQTILRWSQDGSAHPRFDATDLLSLPIPESLIHRGPEVAALINESIRARSIGREHLANATACVDSLIDGPDGPLSGTKARTQRRQSNDRSRR